MKQFRMMVTGALCVVLVLLVGFTQTGCEEAKGVGGLQVNPATVTLAADDTSVVLSVIGGTTNSMLSMPLEWQVSDPNLGQIVASSGLTAVYRRSSANGVNTVTVRDQFEKEGYVTITQRTASYAAEATPDVAQRSVTDANGISASTSNTIE